MHANFDQTLKNVFVDGILKDIHEAWIRKSYRTVLILVYSAIDTMAHLTRDENSAKLTRTDFIAWAEKYLAFRDAKGDRTLALPGIELYAARCALLHSYSSESDLHHQGKVKRQIGYGDEFLPEVAADSSIDNLVMLSVRGLVDAFSVGVIATLTDIGSDEPKKKLFQARLLTMLHELPFSPEN